MSKNVDVVAVVVLLVAAALFGGVKDLVVMGLQRSSRLIHIQRNGSDIYVRPMIPAVPAPPKFPQFQRN
jgi:hypothetical protein